MEILWKVRTKLLMIYLCFCPSAHPQLWPFLFRYYACIGWKSLQEANIAEMYFCMDDKSFLMEPLIYSADYLSARMH